VPAAVSSRIDPVVLFFCGGAFFVCYLGQTVLGVIEPAVQADLGLSSSEGQWVVNAFFLALALCAAPGGRLGDYYGHRNVLLIALVVFSLGSLSAAVADGFAWLVISVGVAGMGASTLYPSSAALVANSTPLEGRGHVLGQYSAIGVSVFALGPVLAGLLTEAGSWRLVFALQLLLGAGLAVLGWRRVQERPAGTPRPFDSSGLVILVLGLTAVLVALMQALTWGWDSPATLALLFAGLAVLAFFGRFEARKVDPLLRTTFLAGRVFLGVAVTMFAAQFMLNGFIIYIATYFQHVLGFSALLASAAMVPAMIGSPSFALIAGGVTDRLGARAPATFGFLLGIAAFAWLAIFAGDRDYWLLLPGLIAAGVAMAPMFTALLTALSNAVPAAERGDANALVLTIRWIGAASGTVVLGVVIRSAPGGESATAGYSAAFWVEAAIVAIGALACVFLLRAPSREEATRPPAVLAGSPPRPPGTT
jgi:MFS family permease